MDEVLSGLGLLEFLKAFEDNRVGVKEAALLTDSEFLLLGVSKIGDRVRIKQKSIEQVDRDTTTLPVVARLRNMVKSRNLKPTSGSNKSKTTRIYAGWKHEESNGLRQVVASRGGGSHPLDLCKEAKEPDILKKMTDMFFPGGKNEAKGVELSHVSTQLATFSGQCLSDFSKGNCYTLGDILQELNTHPVRLYLETRLTNKELFSDDEDDDCESDLPNVNVTQGTKESAESTSRPSQPSTPTVDFPRHRQEESLDLSTYNAYIDLIEDEDEPNDVPMNACAEMVAIRQADSHSLSDILAKLLAFIPNDHPAVQIIIHRRQLLSSTLRATKDQDFSFWRPIEVVFAGEEAQDGGGPTREFFKLLMREVTTSMGVFQTASKSGMVSFTHDLRLIRQQTYKLAGQYLTWSFVNGGPGLRGMCPSAFAAMINKDVRLEDIEHLPDATTRANLVKLQKCTSQEEFDEVVKEMADWLIGKGDTRVFGKKLDCDRDNLIKDLLMHEFSYKVEHSVKQFVDGLGPLWEDVKRSPNCTSQLLVHQEQKLLKADLKKLYKINFSPEGSNKRMQEDDTIYSFEVVLQRCEANTSGISLEQVLDFWTAADNIPPCGFQKDLEVDFYTPVTGIKRLPSSHTCVPLLWLPRGVEDPLQLQDMLVQAITCCQGFGKI